MLSFFKDQVTRILRYQFSNFLINQPVLYRLQQMTAKRNDLMTAQPYDAKLDES